MTQALKRHGGDPDGGPEALERGAENLAAHLRIVKELGFDAVVAVNRFPADSQFELEAVSALALEHGAFGVAVNDGYEHGGAERAPGRARRRGAARTRRPGSCTSSPTT